MTTRFMKEITSVMKTIQVSLEDQVHRRAKTLAYRTGVTLVELIRGAIEDRVERLEQQDAVLEQDRRLH